MCVDLALEKPLLSGDECITHICSVDDLVMAVAIYCHVYALVAVRVFRFIFLDNFHTTELRISVACGNCGEYLRSADLTNFL